MTAVFVFFQCTYCSAFFFFFGIVVRHLFNINVGFGIFSSLFLVRICFALRSLRLFIYLYQNGNQSCLVSLLNSVYNSELRTFNCRTLIWKPVCFNWKPTVLHKRSWRKIYSTALSYQYLKLNLSLANKCFFIAENVINIKR